jgi:hypothetical protein
VAVAIRRRWAVGVWQQPPPGGNLPCGVLSDAVIAEITADTQNALAKGYK